MEPYGSITPAGTSPIKFPAASGGAKSGGKSMGGLLDALGALTGHRVMERMHQAQIAHEATMAQVNHQNTLETIRQVHLAGLSTGQAKYMHKQEMEKLKNAGQLELEAQRGVIDQSNRLQEHDLGMERDSRNAAIEISKSNAEADRIRADKRNEAIIERANREHRTAEAIKLSAASAPGTALNVTEPGGFSTSLVTKPAEVPAKTTAAKAPAKKPAAKKSATKKPSARAKVDTQAADAYND